jgi:ATP-dependent Lon protease
LILPVGGLREKLLAAQRYGLKRVVYPADNQSQIDILPTKLKRSMDLTPLNSIFELKEVLAFRSLGEREMPPTHVDA